MITQGKWEVRLFKLGKRVFVIPSDCEKNTKERDGFGICECLGKDAKANARLIASAPLLLEALKGLVYYAQIHIIEGVTLGSGKSHTDFIDKSLQAIEKAEL
jgi:hypothetical protein